MTIAELNQLGEPKFVERLGAVFEHSPWVAEGAWRRRPFASLETLHIAMTAIVREAPMERKLALVRAHPELAGQEAKAGTLTADSTGEQGRLGFTALTRAEFDRVSRVNRAYRDKFGFPCIVALRLHATRDSVIDKMERRLANDSETEIAAALGQIEHIARGRLEKLIRED